MQNLRISLLTTLCTLSMWSTFALAASKPIILPSPNVESFTNVQDKGGLKIGIKFFTEEETQQIFNTKSFYKNYQPVYISIQNMTHDLFDFKKSLMNTISVSAGSINRNYIPIELKDDQIPPAGVLYGVLFFPKPHNEKIIIRLLCPDTQVVQEFTFTS